MNQYQKFYQKVLNDIKSGKRVSPLKVIRAFCLECVGFNYVEVQNCSAHEGYDCPLFKYRFGKNQSAPKGGVGSPTDTTWASRLRVKPEKVKRSV